MTPTNKTNIVIALISAISVIIAAFIQFFPWESSNKKTKKVSKEYFIAGTVVDEISNKNVSQATVTVVGRNDIYYTEQYGNFKIILKDSISVIRIRVTKTGYSTYDKSYDLPSNSIIIPLTATGYGK